MQAAARTGPALYTSGFNSDDDDDQQIDGSQGETDASEIERRFSLLSDAEILSISDLAICHKIMIMQKNLVISSKFEVAHSRIKNANNTIVSQKALASQTGFQSVQNLVTNQTNRQTYDAQQQTNWSNIAMRVGGIVLGLLSAAVTIASLVMR